MTVRELLRALLEDWIDPDFDVTVAIADPDGNIISHHIIAVYQHAGEVAIMPEDQS